jgi:hypothetical protein
MAFTLQELVGNSSGDFSGAIRALNGVGIMSAIDASLLDDEDIRGVAGSDESLVASLTGLRGMAAVHKNAWAVGAALQGVARISEPAHLSRRDVAIPPATASKTSGASLKRAFSAFTRRFLRHA